MILQSGINWVKLKETGAYELVKKCFEEIAAHID